MTGKLLDFLAENAGWIAFSSIVSMLVALVVVPTLIVRIPVDYFQPKPAQPRSRGSLARVALAAFRNVVGVVVLIVGLLLLFLPGQGVLTLVVGLMIMDFPGKQKAEHWLIGRPYVLPAMNWLRRKYSKPPLTLS